MQEIIEEIKQLKVEVPQIPDSIVVHDFKDIGAEMEKLTDKAVTIGRNSMINEIIGILELKVEEVSL